MEEVSGVDRGDRQPPDPAVGPHEVGHEGRRRPSEHLARGVVLLQHAALGEDRDLVPELGGLVDVVRDEHDGLLQLRLQVEELLLESLPGDGVDRAEGLVHQQHRRVPAQGPGDADALPFTARELMGKPTPVLVGIQPDQVEQLLHPSVHPGAVPAEEAGHRGDVVRHTPMREQPALLDHVADVPAQVDGSIFRTSVPSIRIRPPDGSMSRLIMRSVVVLPQPEGPTRTHSSPSVTVKLVPPPRPSRRRSAWSPGRA